MQRFFCDILLQNNLCNRKQKTLLGKYILRHASDDEFNEASVGNRLSVDLEMHNKGSLDDSDAYEEWWKIKTHED